MIGRIASAAWEAMSVAPRGPMRSSQLANRGWRRRYLTSCSGSVMRTSTGRASTTMPASPAVCAAAPIAAALAGVGTATAFSSRYQLVTGLASADITEHRGGDLPAYLLRDGVDPGARHHQQR